MFPDTNTLNLIFHASVREKQLLAEELQRKYAADFLMDEVLRRDLDLLKKYADYLGRHMNDTGMGRLCVHCAARSGGGCCSVAMADETDAIQMLMNMLAGVQVRQVGRDKHECCYLGEKGCLFRFKPMFCLNYNCRNIYNALSSENILALEQLTGQLLTKQYEVEQRLLYLLGNY